MHALQTPFDQAFVVAVQYLKDHWQQHKKFRHLKELFGQMDLNYKSWSGIRNGLRNVPTSKVLDITKVLTNDYGVSAAFLKTNDGNILSSKATWSKNGNAFTKDQLIKQLKEQVKQQQKEIMTLKQQIKRAKTRAKTRKTHLKAIAK